MKILTLNTWQECGDWQKRWEVILSGLDQFKPDIVGFQELFNGSRAGEIKKRAQFPHCLFKDEKCGQVLYSRFPVKEWGVEPLTRSPLEEYGRSLLWAGLEVKKEKLFVFNTHFSWMPEDGATRTKQAEEVLEWILRLAPQGESVLMGDLNAPCHSPEIGTFIRRGEFHDLYFEKHPHDSGFTWDNRNPYVAQSEHKLPDRRIDFILTHKPVRFLKDLASCEIVFTKSNVKGFRASDHYGVLAEFKS